DHVVPLLDHAAVRQPVVGAELLKPELTALEDAPAPAAHQLEHLGETSFDAVATALERGVRDEKQRARLPVPLSALVVMASPVRTAPPRSRLPSMGSPSCSALSDGGSPPHKALKLTDRRFGACRGRPAAGRPGRGGLAGRPSVVASWCTGGQQVSAAVGA